MLHTIKNVPNKFNLLYLNDGEHLINISCFNAIAHRHPNTIDRVLIRKLVENPVKAEKKEVAVFRDFEGSYLFPV